MKIKIASLLVLSDVTLIFALACAPALAGTVNCDSYNGGRNACSADTRNGVALARQLSSAKCKKGVSWDVQNDNRIWVDQDAAAYSRPA